MKKIDKFLVAMALLIIAIPLSKVAWRVYCEIKPLNTDHLSGKFLLPDPNSSEQKFMPEGDNAILDFNNSEERLIKIDNCGKAIFFGSSSKILFVDESVSEGIYVVLYDVETEQREVVHHIDDEAAINGSLSYVRLAYVDENHFSVGTAHDMRIVLVDLNTKEGNPIVEDAFAEHSWYDGKILYFSRMDGIYSYNMETGEEEYIVDGGGPDISSDGKILIYGHGGLRVRNLETGKEWNYGHNTTESCISPDGNYVAVIEEWRGGLVPLKCKTVRIWDYKHHSSYKVAPYYSGEWYLDWVE